MSKLVAVEYKRFEDIKHIREAGRKILDFMGSTELIANLFRISQTEEKLRKDQI